MRQITTHAINPCNEAISVQALDGPGPGGASQHYLVCLAGAFDAMDPRCTVSAHLQFQNGPVHEGEQVHDDNNESCALSDPETTANPATRGLPCTCPKKINGVNGITHESLLAVLIDRMRGFQAGPWRCAENALALSYLEGALSALNARTKVREARGVEGTHKV